MILEAKMYPSANEVLQGIQSKICDQQVQECEKDGDQSVR